MTLRTRRYFMTSAIAGLATLPVATAIAAATGARTHVVEIRNNTYVPANLAIRSGDSVRFVNRDIAPHTVTSDNGKFDSGRFLLGGSVTMTFVTPGRYPYFCQVHDEMHGNITVG